MCVFEGDSSTLGMLTEDIIIQKIYLKDLIDCLSEGHVTTAIPNNEMFFLVCFVLE